MKLTYDPLWNRINTFTIDEPDASLTFSHKLARENSWDRDFAERAVQEYKRFIYLSCALPNGAFPSPVVRKVWNAHMLYTENYWEAFCGKTLGRKLHHHPLEEDKERLRKTLHHYKLVFGVKPPGDIWRKVVDKEMTLRKWGVPGILLMLCITAYANDAHATGLMFLFLMIIAFILSRVDFDPLPPEPDTTKWRGIDGCSYQDKD